MLPGIFEVSLRIGEAMISSSLSTPGKPTELNGHPKNNGPRQACTKRTKVRDGRGGMQQAYPTPASYAAAATAVYSL